METSYFQRGKPDVLQKNKICSYNAVFSNLHLNLEISGHNVNRGGTPGKNLKIGTVPAAWGRMVSLFLDDFQAGQSGKMFDAHHRFVAYTQ